MKDLKTMFAAANATVAVESEVTSTGDVDTGVAPVSEDAFAQAITESETSLGDVTEAHDDVVEAHDDFDTVLEASEHIDETFQVAVESIAAGADYAVVRPLAVANLRYAFRRIGLEGEINGAEAEGETAGVEVPVVEKGEAAGLDAAAPTDVMGDNSVETPKEAEATPTSALVSAAAETAPVVAHVDGVECGSGLCPVCGAASVESLGDKAKAFAETVIKALKAAWEHVKAFYTRVFTHLGRLDALAKNTIARIEARKEAHAVPKINVSLVAPFPITMFESIISNIAYVKKYIDSKKYDGAGVTKDIFADSTATEIAMGSKDAVKVLTYELSMVKRLQDIKGELSDIDSFITKLTVSAFVGRDKAPDLAIIKGHQANATRLTNQAVNNVSLRVHAIAKAFR